MTASGCSGAWIQQPKVASHWDLLGWVTKTSDPTFSDCFICLFPGCLVHGYDLYSAADG